MPSRRSSDSTATLSLFKEQPSILMRLSVLSVLALCLMVADSRMQLMPVLRQGIALVITPLERATEQPVKWAKSAYDYFSGVEQARVEEDTVRMRLVVQSLRAALVEDLTLENQRLRALLGLRESESLSGRAAQVLYEAPDPYSQRLIVDRGLAHSIRLGSPVLDGHGVLGQVTRVLPLTAEVTLLTNQKFTISVINARTGTFGVAYGDPTMSSRKATGSLELRFVPINADVREGDLLITSGIDGIYPSGLPVARVSQVMQNTASLFASIWCEPVAGVHNTRYVMIVEPSGQLITESENMANISNAVLTAPPISAPVGDNNEANTTTNANPAEGLARNAP